MSRITERYPASRMRYFLFYTLSYAVQLWLAAAVYLAFFPQPLGSAGVLILLLAPAAMAGFGALVYAPKLTIEVRPGRVTGYSTLVRRRAVIPRSRLDKEESGQYGLWQRVKGYTYIFSLDGERIVLSHVALGWEQAEEILRQLGC